MASKGISYGSRVVLSGLLLAAASGAVITANYADNVASQVGKQYSAGYVTLAKGKASAAKQLGAAKTQLKDGKATLVSSRQQLDDGKAQLDTAKTQLDEASVTLTTSAQQLADGEAQLGPAKQQLDEGRATLDDAKIQLANGAQQLASGKQTLDEKAQELAAGRKTLADGEAQYQAGLAQAEQGKATLAAAKTAQTQLTTLQTELGKLNQALVNPKATLSNAGLADYMGYFPGATTWQDYLNTALAFKAATTTTVDPSIQPIVNQAVSQGLAAAEPTIKEQIQQTTAAQFKQASSGADNFSTPDGQVVTQPVFAALYGAQIEQQVRAVAAQEAQKTAIASLNNLGNQTIAGIDTLTQSALGAEPQLQQLVAQGAQIAPNADFTPLTQALALPETNTAEKLTKTLTLNAVLSSPAFTETLSGGLASLDAQIKAGTAQLAAADQQLTQAAAQLTTGRKTLTDGQAAWNEGAATYQAGVTELANKTAEYQAGEATYASGLAQYNQGAAQLADGQQQYADGLVQFQDGQRQYDDGMKSYTENEAAYQKGLKDWNDGNTKYQAAQKAATKQINDGEKQLSTAKSVLVTLGSKISKATGTRLTAAPTVTNTTGNWQWLAFGFLGLSAFITAIWLLFGTVRRRRTSEFRQAILSITVQNALVAGGASLIGVGATVLIVPAVIRSLAGNAINPTAAVTVIAGTVVGAIALNLIGFLVAKNRAAKETEPDQTQAAG